MPAFWMLLRRGVVALAVFTAPAGAQTLCGGCLIPPEPATPPLQPARLAGQLGAGVVGFTLGAEGGLVAAAGVAYLVRGHGGDITTPGLKAFATGVLMVGGGVGAATGSYLVSRANGQTSNFATNAAVSTAVTALAFKYAGWPMTPESRARPMSRWRRMAPVWMSALSATIVAAATRERR